MEDQVASAGTSSPITTGDKIIVTCNAGYGVAIGFDPRKDDGQAGDQHSLKRVVACYDRKNGAELWKKEISPQLPESTFVGFMREHSYSTSTPVTDGTHVFVFFGKTGVFAFDLKGEQIWQADVGKMTNPWGTGASPILYKDLLIINAAIESNSLVALDKKTGKEIWRKKGIGRSWSSPIIVKTKEGKDELVIHLPAKLAGYNPATGEELWTCSGNGCGGEAATPVARDGIVYAISSPLNNTAFAVKAGGRGEVNETHILWKYRTRNVQCSPVLFGDHMCWVAGTMFCLNIADGKVTSKTTIHSGDGRTEYPSAVVAGGKIYAFSRDNGLFVITAGEKVETLSQLRFPEDTSIFTASPAISDERMYLRSNTYLYCVGAK